MKNVSFKIKELRLFDKNWLISADDESFLIIREVQHSTETNLKLPITNKVRIIDEGLKYYKESCEINREPRYLILTEDIINQSFVFNKKKYDKGYLKLVISKDELGFGFFIIQTAITNEMTKNTKFSIHGDFMKSVRLTIGDISKN